MSHNMNCEGKKIKKIFLCLACISICVSYFFVYKSVYMPLSFSKFNITVNGQMFQGQGFSLLLF